MRCLQQNLTERCKATLPQFTGCRALGDPGSPVTGCVIDGTFLTCLAFAGPSEKYQEHNTKKYKTHLLLFFHQILKTISEVGWAASTLSVRPPVPSLCKLSGWGWQAHRAESQVCVQGPWGVASVPALRCWSLGPPWKSLGHMTGLQMTLGRGRGAGRQRGRHREQLP